MKKITSITAKHLVRAFLMLLVFNSTLYAQSGTYLTWNKHVGCITYDSQGQPDDPRKELILLEEIEDAPCIRVCEFSTVNYVLNGPNIANVQWSASGGNITSIGGAANKNATIAWGDDGNGAIDLTILYSNGTQTTITVCMEIINGPKADFGFYGVTQEPAFCIDTPINFQNLSNNNGGSEIVSYFWDFGDGDVSYTFEPTHEYDQPGTYYVRLVVTNNCNCSSSYEFPVHIENKPNVIINCASVACEYDTVTYTAEDECGGSWIVEGGHIMNQTGTSVEVKWDSVDSEGFGYVSYRSECTCPFWTTIKIPVILNGGTIEGPDTLCLNEQGLYTLPQWPSTDFEWVLTPSSSSGTHLVFNDQRNQIIVDALAPGEYELRCSYTNTLLGCSGGSKKTIKVVEGTEIIGGAEEICSGTNLNFTTTGGASVQWELKKNNTVVANTTGVNFTYNYPTGGVYTLTATAGGCLSEPKVISVTQRPSTPSGISGEMQYCPNVPYTYTLNNTVPNTVLDWDVTNGTIQGDDTGNEITVIFNNTATASVKVRRVSLDGMACASGYTTLSVNKVVINPTITPNTSSTVFCPSSESTFNVNMNGVAPDLITWSVIPSNFGNVISGTNSNTVVVSWNEVSSSPNGILRLTVKKCGEDVYIDTPIELFEAPTMTLTAPNQICYGDNLNLTLTAPGITSGSITWDLGNGVTQTTPVNGSSNYSLPNPYNNTTSNNINYNITATLNQPNGCNIAVEASDSIIVYPRTIISVTPGYNYQVCPTSYSPFTLSANAATGIGVTVSYQWFKNGGTISGATGSTYTISNATQGTTPQGTYYVQATDSNGCIVNSQNIIVSAECGPPEPCEITPAPNLSLNANWSACNTISASASYVGTPTNVQWIGSPFLTITNSNNTSAQFTTDVPGAHLVTVKVTYQTASGPCTVQETVEVKKHYEADFNTTITCNSGTGKYNISLLNDSMVFDVSSPITYNFTGPGITSSPTGQTVNLTNINPGTYNYTLTLSMAGKPSCSITKTITLDPMPTVNFSLGNTTYCSDESISLTIPNYNPVNTYLWQFTGTGYYASGPTTLINIDANGNFEITLTAITPHGCSFTGNPEEVSVSKPTYNGGLSITPGNNVCEGTSPAPTITFNMVNPLETPPSTYIWMKGNQQMASTTSSSYSPTSSGNYWVKLLNAQGCSFTGTNGVSVTIRPRPYAGIVGSTSICSGEQGTITGVVTNNTLQRRWLLNGSPMTSPYGTWSNSTPLTVNVPTTTGTYNYTFEVRPATDTGCGSSASTSVTVNPPVNAPVLSYYVDTCEPYKVYVNASGPSQGMYNWSNGMTGQTILVGTGGAFGVTYTAPTGCTATADIMVPQPLERSLWVFPEGCYDVCYNTNPAPYIIGPLGIFDTYKWMLNGNVQVSGTNSSIQPLPVTQGGAYQLTVQNDGCTLESGIMSLVPNIEECDMEPCGFKSDIKENTAYEGGMYLVFGYIDNTSGVPITVTITSFNNYGTYIPGSVTIPPYTTYNFSPLQFIPNSNFNGGNDYIVLQMQGCMTVYPVKFETNGQQGFGSGARPAQMSVVPNPAQEYSVIHYDLGDSYKQVEDLVVFDLLGNQKIVQKLDKNTGDAEIFVGNLPSGTYIVSIQADGIRAIQQTLVKK